MRKLCKRGFCPDRNRAKEEDVSPMRAPFCSERCFELWREKNLETDD